MKKLVALFLAVIFAMSAMVGCGGTAETPAAEAPAAEAPVAEEVVEPAAEETAVEEPAAEEKVFRTYLTQDSPTLNGHDSVNRSVETPHIYCSASLYRPIPSEDGKSFTYLADLAEDWPEQIDAHTWQIKINPEAKWQNGEPINADTFIYSYKMDLDPILANQLADVLASMSVAIVNAKAYALQGTSNTVAWEDVGIKKIDDYTIQIITEGENTVEQVMEQFNDRSCCPVYEPYYEAGMNEARTETTYGRTKEEWMGCGPYILDTWVNDSIQIYVKDPTYIHADMFHYDRVEVRIIPTVNARVELWEKGELDYLELESTNIESYIDSPALAEDISNVVTHIDINDQNTDCPILAQLSFRKAIYHAINRDVCAKLAGYQIPAGFYINKVAGVYGESGVLYRDTPQGKSTTDLIDSWGPNGYNEELAKKYFDEAYEAAGCEGVVNIRLMYEDDYSDFAACTEYLQQELPRIFGEDKVAIEALPISGGTTAYKKAVGLNGWDLSWNDWSTTASGTYPHTAYRYFITSYASRPNSYTDAEFDAQYDICNSEEVKADYERLMDETAKLEQIYLDKLINVPVFQTVSYALFSDRLELPVSMCLPSFGWGQQFGDIN